MGLDAVELLMEIEEEFGISIDDESFSLANLGGLHDHLLKKCTGRKRSDCPSQAAFYRLRRALGAVFHVAPRSIRPATQLLPLLGVWGRRRQWKRLKKELSLRMPGMENRAGAGVGWGFVTAPTISFLAAALGSGDLWLAAGIAVFSLLPGVLIGFAIGLCWPPTLARSRRTAGWLAQTLALLNGREFRSSEVPPAEDAAIWNRLCDVIVRQLGVPRESLHRGASLANLLS